MDMILLALYLVIAATVGYMAGVATALAVIRHKHRHLSPPIDHEHYERRLFALTCTNNSLARDLLGLQREITRMNAALRRRNTAIKVLRLKMKLNEQAEQAT